MHVNSLWLNWRPAREEDGEGSWPAAVCCDNPGGLESRRQHLVVVVRYVLEHDSDCPDGGCTRGTKHLAEDVPSTTYAGRSCGTGHGHAKAGCRGHVLITGGRKHAR